MNTSILLIHSRNTVDHCSHGEGTIWRELGITKMRRNAAMYFKAVQVYHRGEIYPLKGDVLSGPPFLC